jgi:hypothetical protein
MSRQSARGVLRLEAATGVVECEEEKVARNLLQPNSQPNGFAI